MPSKVDGIRKRIAKGNFDRKSDVLSAAPLAKTVYSAAQSHLARDARLRALKRADDTNPRDGLTGPSSNAQT
jgi:hypothetical protein